MVPMRITFPSILLREPAITVPWRWYISWTISPPLRPSGTLRQTTVLESLSACGKERSPRASQPARRAEDTMRLLRGGGYDIDPPLVLPHVDTAEAADRIPPQERGPFAQQPADGMQVGDYA